MDYGMRVSNRLFDRYSELIEEALAHAHKKLATNEVERRKLRV
jgi:hypothetical protein